MWEKIFAVFGKAGIGGLALGVLLYIFRDVIERVLLVDVRLTSTQVFYIVAALLILTFGIAMIGILAGLISNRNPDQPIPSSSLGLLAFLFCVVIGAAMYFLGSARLDTLLAGSPPPSPTSFKICMGNGGGDNCKAGANASFDCNQYSAIGGGGARTTTTLGAQFCSATIDGKKKQQPFDIKVIQNNGGGQCGWTAFLVTCNPRI